MRLFALVLTVAACGRFGFDEDRRGTDGSVDVDAIDAAPTFTANIVFVTSTNHMGDLGGLAGADAICMQRAAEQQLPGNYVAWLSSSTTSAISRLGNARGWVRPDGKPVFDRQADLLAGRVLYPPRLDERGIDRGMTPVLTATGRDGLRATTGTTCGDWTSPASQLVAVGEASVASGGWTFTGFNATCDQPRPLFCFGIDRGDAVVASAPNARLAFIETSGNLGNMTVGGADAKCMTAATNAMLPGTYKALLATTTASAASRFSTSGPPWARVDGVLLADTAADLFAAPLWHSALAVDAKNTQNLAFTGVWTGAANPMQIGNATSTCNDWMSVTPNGTNGTSDDSAVARAFAFGTTTCGQTYALFCLQD